MERQLTVWQHYVPQMYLKNFGTIIKKKKDMAFVSFYQFNKELLKSDIPVDSICAKNNFYDKDNHIERMLCQKEIEWSNCFKEIMVIRQK